MIIKSPRWELQFMGENDKIIIGINEKDVQGVRNMKKDIFTRATAVMLASALVFPLNGCASKPGSEELSEPMETIEGSIGYPEGSTESESGNHAEQDSETTFLDQELGLTEQQRNSFSMLYHLAITAENIRISKDNRLILEDIYTSLLNDINPGAIDEITQDQLENLRDIIKTYMNISVKRDRLQYIYNQNKAEAMRSAVPDPLAILSVSNAFNWKKLALTVGYTLVDSYNNYKSASASADQEFLMSGWELDDEETEAIQNNREQAFDYMVDVVQKYHLDGKMTLNEKAIEAFSEICAIESVPQRLQRLESEFDTYKLLGNYWLALADCYYETDQYEKCLECIDYYNQLSTGIYRKDYNYVQVLPKAIIAAQNVSHGDEYVANVGKLSDDIIENTTTDQWARRYFAAQVYMDLYARTQNTAYSEKAYEIIYSNVGVLLKNQLALNEEYLHDVQEVEVTEPDYDYLSEQKKEEEEKRYKAEKKRVKAYNEDLHERRETELPPLYEPLILNCDMLFALADEMQISDQEKKEIEAVLETDHNGVFLSDPINNRYSFFPGENSQHVVMDTDYIQIPVALLSAGAEVLLEISDNHNTVSCDDCVVAKVERETESFDSFVAYVSSEKMDEIEWSDNSRVTIKIINGDEENPLVFRYKVVGFEDKWIISDTVVFEEE